MELRRRLTIYRGVRRHLAKAVNIGWRDDPLGTLIAFKPCRVPGWRYYEDKDANTVVLAGWDHPEFEQFIAGFQVAPVRQLTGVTHQTGSIAIDTNESASKTKYEAYLKSLAPERILFDSRITKANRVPDRSDRTGLAGRKDEPSSDFVFMPAKDNPVSIGAPLQSMEGPSG